MLAAECFDEHLDILAGVSRGVDAQLLTAITGKSAGKYNGKYGEVGVDAHTDMGQYWLNFLKARIKDMNMEQFERFVNTGKTINKSEPYGFDNHFTNNFRKFA
jgi:hypothetical protein